MNNIICVKKCQCFDGCDIQSSYYCNYCCGYFCDNHSEDHLKYIKCSICDKESCKDSYLYNNSYNNICFDCYVNLCNCKIQEIGDNLLEKSMEIDGDNTIELIKVLQKVSNTINNSVNKR